MHVIKHDTLPGIELPGRTMWIHASPEIGNAAKLSMNIVRFAPAETSHPAHSHPGAEELVHVLCGEVEFYVLNPTGRHFHRLGPGDSIVFQEADIHMTRNIGSKPLELACCFSPPASPATYRMFESIRYGDQSDA